MGTEQKAVKRPHSEAKATGPVAGNDPLPRGTAKSLGFSIPVPTAGERFDEQGIGARFGVPTTGGIRVNHEKKCIVLVDRVDGNMYQNVDDGDAVDYMGRNQPGDYDGDRDQTMTAENLILKHSKEDGYTVLYFMKEGSDLVFSRLVEYRSDRTAAQESRRGRKRNTIIFTLGTIHGEASARPPARGTPGAAAAMAAPQGAPDLDLIEMVERRVMEPRTPTSRMQLAQSLQGRVGAGQLDRILEYLARSSKIEIDGDAIRWTFGTADLGVDGLDRGGGPAESMAEGSIGAGDAGRPLTWSEAETMAILEDKDLMKALEESDADMRAGRVSVWKPEDA